MSVPVPVTVLGILLLLLLGLLLVVNVVDGAIIGVVVRSRRDSGNRGGGGGVIAVAIVVVFFVVLPCCLSLQPLELHDDFIIPTTIVREILLGAVDKDVVVVMLVLFCGTTCSLLARSRLRLLIVLRCLVHQSLGGVVP